VLKLHKALYGLRQAPRAWNCKSDSVLHDLGFERCKTEHELYIRIQNRCRFVVGVYVDDLIITGESIIELENFKEEMKRAFRVSNLGALSYYLGNEVRQEPHGIELSQCAYALKLLERTGLKNCNPCGTPMEAKLKLSKSSNSPPVDATEYRSLICSLRYLLHTMPDLTFSVNYLSRFMEEPKQEHYVAVKRLLCYVAGTVDYGLMYPRGNGGEISIVGYNDSDMGGDVDDSKSTSGVVFFLGENLAT
jgi:hypothetical protein